MSEGEAFTYALTLSAQPPPYHPTQWKVGHEQLVRHSLGEASETLLERHASRIDTLAQRDHPGGFTGISDETPLISAMLEGIQQYHDELVAAAQAIAGIRVGVGFDVLPTWVARALKRPSSPLRERAQTNAVDGLDLLGSNLAEAYFTFINEPAYKRLWPEILSTIQLGFGEQRICRQNYAIPSLSNSWWSATCWPNWRSRKALRIRMNTSVGWRFTRQKPCPMPILSSKIRPQVTDEEIKAGL